MRKKNDKSLNIEIKGPSVGLVTGVPSEQAGEKSATLARNVRFDDSVARSAPGFAGVVLDTPLDSVPLLIHQARLSSAANPDNKLPIVATRQKIYSIDPQAPANLPPVVSAGPDLRLDANNGLDAQLFGSATDPDGDALTLLWTKVSGPGTVTFSDEASAFTEASVSVAGEYVLRLTANDGTNPDVFDEMELSFVAVPVVDAGENQTLNAGCGGTVSLEGTASDSDGAPSPLVTLWTVVTGNPAAVTFADPNALTTDAEITEDGVFVFRLEATDGEFTVSDTVQIEIVNQAPVVSAGSDGSVTLDGGSATFQPSASASDPDATDTLTYEWSSDSPGVSFDDVTALQPTVTLTEEGTATLTLTASDGCTSTQDTVDVVVGAASDDFTTVEFGDGLTGDVWAIGFETYDKGFPNFPTRWANGDDFGTGEFESTPFLRLTNIGGGPEGLDAEFMEANLTDEGAMNGVNFYSSSFLTGPLNYNIGTFMYPQSASAAAVHMFKWRTLRTDCAFLGLRTERRSVDGGTPFIDEQRAGTMVVDASWSTAPVFTDLVASRIRFEGHGFPDSLGYTPTTKFTPLVTTVEGTAATASVSDGDDELSCGTQASEASGIGYVKAKVPDSGLTDTADEVANFIISGAQFKPDGGTTAADYSTVVGGVPVDVTFSGDCGAQSGSFTLDTPISWSQVVFDQVNDLWTGDPDDYIYDSSDADYKPGVAEPFIAAWMADVADYNAACRGTVSGSKIRMVVDPSKIPFASGTVEVRVRFRNVRFPVISLLGPGNTVEERGPIGGQNGVLAGNKIHAQVSGVGSDKPSTADTVIDTTAAYNEDSDRWETEWITVAPLSDQYGYARVVDHVGWRPIV